MSSSFQFSKPPGAIGAELRRRIDRIPAAMLDLGTSYASRMESSMRTNAPWTDQTGDARASLTGEASQSGGVVTITLYGTVDYQGFLEFGTAPRDNGHPGMAPRPIIGPTMQQYSTEIVESAAKLVTGLLTGGGAL